MKKSAKQCFYSLESFWIVTGLNPGLKPQILNTASQCLVCSFWRLYLQGPGHSGPHPMGGSAPQEQRASVGLAPSVCCCPCQPWGPAQRALRCLTHATHLSGFYYKIIRLLEITGVPESSPSASEFLTMQPFVFPPILTGFYQLLFFLPTFIVLTTLYIAITFIKGKFVDILFNHQSPG